MGFSRLCWGFQAVGGEMAESREANVGHEHRSSDEKLQYFHF